MTMPAMRTLGVIIEVPEVAEASVRRNCKATWRVYWLP